MLVERGISFPRYRQFLNLGIIFFVCALVVVPFWSLVIYVFNEKPVIRGENLGNSFDNLKSLSKRGTGKAKLSLNGALNPLGENDIARVKFPLLKDMLIFLENTPRPDHKKLRDVFVLGLEGSHEKKVFTDGEIVYLDCSSENEISFSEVISPFYFIPKFKENNELDIEFTIDFKGDDGEIIYQDSQNFTLKKKNNFATIFHGNMGELGPITDFLAKVKIYESDLFIQMYGGKSFDDIKSSYRICFDNSESPLFIKAGDMFVWKDGRISQDIDKTEGLPLIKVTSLDTYKCELSLWDSEGIYNKVITLQISKPSSNSVKPQDIFLKLNQRTEASVTCQLNNRNVIIRKGDWLLHSKGKFRNLRTYDEVNDFLRYALKGELFIFDGIIKKEGVSLFVGHLFNEERSQAKTIEIPFSERKKQTPLKKKEIKPAAMQVKDE